MKYMAIENDVGFAKMPGDIESEWRTISKNIGLVYLGETISFFVACVNDAETEQLSDVTIRVDLQTTSRVVMIIEQKLATLDAGKSHGVVLHHEIKEMGGSVYVT